MSTQRNPAERCDQLTEKFGPRFATPALLREMADDGLAPDAASFGGAIAACEAAGRRAEALREVGGADAVARLRFERDAAIERIVSGWPTAAHSDRAARLGFAADRPFIEAVRDFAASLERN